MLVSGKVCYNIIEHQQSMESTSDICFEPFHLRSKTSDPLPRARLLPGKGQGESTGETLNWVALNQLFLPFICSWDLTWHDTSNHTSSICIWNLEKYFILFEPSAFQYTHTYIIFNIPPSYYIHLLQNSRFFWETFEFLLIPVPCLVIARRTSKPCSACGTLPRPCLKQASDL